MKSEKLFSLVAILFVLACNISTSSVFSTSDLYTLNFLDSVSLNVGYTMSIEGNYAYVANNEGVSVINITDPTNMEQTTAFSFPTGALGVYVEDGFVYVACYSSGFFIVDARDLSNPILLGNQSHTGIAAEVYTHNEYAFVTYYETGMTIYDISNKSEPIAVSTYFEGGSTWDVVVTENIAYVANSGVGVEVVDISNPSSPFRLTTLSGTIPSTSIAIYEDMLFVGRHGSGINIYNISTPSNPLAMGFYSDSDDGEERGVSGNNTRLCVADANGVELFDLENLPTITRLAKYQGDIDNIHDSVLRDNYIFVTDGLIGFTALEIIPPTSETNYTFLSGFLIAMAVLFIKKKK